MTIRLHLLVASFVLLLVLPCSAASAQDASTPSREASRHFQRGVALYGEADYRAALVEFRRAYAIAPHTSVLYDIGEAQFQLQDYAAALTTFERYLAESGSTDAHRAEVESTVEVLKSRVGHVSVTTVPAGADVTIDDQPVGRTPIDKPVLVSIGHRKIIATLAGRPAVTRYVDIATDDSASVTVVLPEVSTSPATTAPRVATPAPSPEPVPASHGGAWRALGWIGTGVLAAGAVTFGVLAEKASSDLASERATYPVSQATLQRQASLTSTYSVLADSLAIGAVVTGSVTLLSTIFGSSDAPPPRDRAGTAHVDLGPTSAQLRLSF